MSVFQRTFWAGVQNMGEFTKNHGEYEQFDRKHVERRCFQVFPVRAKEATRVTDRPLAGNTFIESSDKSRFLPTLDRKHFYGNIVWRTVCMKNTDHRWAQIMRSLYIVKECEVRRFSRDFQWTAATWFAGLCVTVSLTPWNGTRTYTYVASVKLLLLLLLLFTEEKKRKHVVVLFSNSEHYHLRKLRCICNKEARQLQWRRYMSSESYKNKLILLVYLIYTNEHLWWDNSICKYAKLQLNWPLVFSIVFAERQATKNIRIGTDREKCQNRNRQRKNHLAKIITWLFGSTKK